MSPPQLLFARGFWVPLTILSQARFASYYLVFYRQHSAECFFFFPPLLSRLRDRSLCLLPPVPLSQKSTCSKDPLFFSPRDFFSVEHLRNLFTSIIPRSSRFSSNILASHDLNAATGVPLLDAALPCFTCKKGVCLQDSPPVPGAFNSTGFLHMARRWPIVMITPSGVLPSETSSFPFYSPFVLRLTNSLLTR